MGAGRPTIYTAELIAKAKYYITHHEEVTEGKEVIPSHQGMAKYLGISTTSLYDWAKDEDKKEFAETLALCNQSQYLTLLNKGLKNEFNSNIVKLALGNHGMSEKHQQEISGPNGNPIENKWTVEFINPSDATPKNKP